MPMRMRGGERELFKFGYAEEVYRKRRKILITKSNHLNVCTLRLFRQSNYIYVIKLNSIGMFSARCFFFVRSDISPSCFSVIIDWNGFWLLLYMAFKCHLPYIHKDNGFDCLKWRKEGDRENAFTIFSNLT